MAGALEGSGEGLQKLFSKKADVRALALPSLSKASRIFWFLFWAHWLVLILAAASFLSNAGNGVPDSLPAFGFRGSVNGRILKAKQGAFYFFVGRGKTQINIENPNPLLGARLKLNQETIFSGPLKRGGNKITFPAHKGPVYLHLSLSRVPKKAIILGILPSKEYRWAKRAIRNLLFLSFAALLAFLFAKKGLVFLLRRYKKIFFVAFTFYFSCGFFILDAFPVPLTGDEPHYLLFASSLYQDGDLNLLNQYAGRQYMSYIPSLLGPHAIERNGILLPLHYPLLSILSGWGFLLPKIGLQADVYHTAKFSILFLSAVSSACLFVLYRFWGRAPALAGLVLGIGMPWFAYSIQIFPGVLASFAMGTLGFYLLVSFPLQRRPRLAHRFQKILCSFGYLSLVFCATLPLLHLKFIVVSVVSCLLLWGLWPKQGCCRLSRYFYFFFCFIFVVPVLYLLALRFPFGALWQ